MNRVNAAFNKIIESQDKTLNKILNTLEQSKNNHYIEEGFSNWVTPLAPKFEDDVKEGKSVGTSKHLDLSESAKQTFKKQNGVESSDMSTVSHEMQHMYDYDIGNMADHKESSAEDPAEKRVVKTENVAREIEGLQEKTKYGDKIIKY